MPDENRGHPRRWLILALVLVAECMDLLDSTIVNVAAPTVQKDLHASTSALQWVIGGYALTFSVGLVTGARLGDIYGRRRLFVLGAWSFVATSLACAFAVDPGMLIATRLLQGFAAALLIPQGLGVLRAVFAPAEQPKAFGLFGPVIALSAVLGPVVGGLLVDADLVGSGWRLIFFVNLPLGLLAAIGAARLMPESRSPQPTRLDLVGNLLVAAATGLLVYPLIQGREAGWPTWSYVMIVASPVPLLLLAPWTRRVRRLGRDPMIETSVFRNRGFSAGLAMILVFFGGMIGTLLVLGLFLQFGEHFSAIHAGLTVAPFALGSGIGATLSGAVLTARLGRMALQLGSLVMAGGVLWLLHVLSANGMSTSSLDLLPPQLLLGAGLGMLVAPLFDFALGAVSDSEAGSASGVLNSVQQLAGALGVAILGTIFFDRLGHHGFLPAIRTCLLVELGTVPVLFGLTLLLPRYSRTEGAEEPAVPVPSAA